MILTPSERTEHMLDALDMWICEEFERLPLEQLKLALDCREVLIGQLEEDECECSIAPGYWDQP